jgi:hypothetical protein
MAESKSVFVMALGDPVVTWFAPKDISHHRLRKLRSVILAHILPFHGFGKI